MSDIKSKISRRKIQENAIDNVVSDWKEDPRMGDLLKETVAQESHYGDLAPNNPYQVGDMFLQDLHNPKYQPQLDVLGAKWKNGELDISDPRTAAIVAAMRYEVGRGGTYDLHDQVSRARLWKKRYNTDSGKGTVNKYLNTQKVYGNQ